MLNKIKGFFKGVRDKLFRKESFPKGVTTNIILSDLMAEKIELWDAMYRNKSPWLNPKTKSMNLASSISSEVARLVTLEMKSEITGESERAAYLNEYYSELIERARNITEFAAAKGGIVLKPIVKDKKIIVDSVHAENFYPLKYDSNGEITSALFTDSKTIDKSVYTKVEIHRLEDNQYHISSRAFRKERNNHQQQWGNEVNLNSVEGWEDIEPEVTINNIERTLFTYYKMPFANAIDSTSPLGISVFDKATDMIRDADENYSRFIWELKASERKINASEDLFKKEEVNGKSELVFPSGEDGLYRTFDFMATDDINKNITTYAPEIREESYKNSLNIILRKVEFNCGLAYGTISDEDVTAKTATEIKSSKQRSYSMVCDIQKALEKSLKEVIEIMDILCDLYELCPSGDYEVSFTFDDSIIVDTETEQRIRLQEVAAGLVKPENYLAWRYGITEEMALDMIPGAEEGGEGDE